MSTPRPEIIVLGGPNGAGKTTAAKVLLPEWLGIDQFVNADLIAAGLSPFAPHTAAFEGARLMLRRLHALRDQRISFGFETTLASRSYVPFLREAVSRGYLVHILFIWLESVDIAIQRIAQRVHLGGHDVPTTTVIRRYHRARANFQDLYQPLASAWRIYDNSGSAVRVIASRRRGGVEKVFDSVAYDRFRKQE